LKSAAPVVSKRSVLDGYIAPATIALFLALQGTDRMLPIAWAILTLGSLLTALRGGIDFQRRVSPIEKGFGIALAACLLSAAFGLDAQRSLLLSVPVLASLLLWILIARGSQAQAKSFPVAAGLAIAAGLQSICVLMAARRHPEMLPADWVADAGAAWLVVPNDMAWIACVLPLWALTARGRSLLVVFGLLAGFLVLCALMQSRTAAIVAIAVALSFAGASLGARLRTLTWVAAAGLVVLALAVASHAASMHARLQLWAAAWSMFLDHPWTGVGIHNFVLAYRQYLPAAELVDSRITPWPHDLPLEIAAECGLIGIFAFLFLAGNLVRQGAALLRTGIGSVHRAALVGLCGLAVLGLVEASLLRQWFWLLGTALCALLENNALFLGKHKNEQ
jgi:O-antigen ligase